MKNPAPSFVAAMVLLLAALTPFPAPAQSDLVAALLRPGWQTDGNGRMAALELRLGEGWKTYWRAPGDVGIPPRFDWSASDNVASVAVHWPAPFAFTQSGMTTLGYDGQVVLPLEITANDPARPMLLRGRVEIGICRDICVPMTLEVEGRFHDAGTRDPVIVAALAQRPQSAQVAGLSGMGCTVEPIGDGLRMTATMDLPPTGGTERVAIEPGSGTIWVSEPQVTRSGGRLTAVTDLVPPRGAPFALDRTAMTLTVVGSDRVVEIKGCPAP